MRKRRRLANKLTIMMCAVLIAVSAFFYVPIESNAAEIVDYDYHYDRVTNAQVIYHNPYMVRLNSGFRFDESFLNTLDDDLYYLVDFDYTVEFEFDTVAHYATSHTYLVNSKTNNSIIYLKADGNTGTIKSWTGNSAFVDKGSNIKQYYDYFIHLMSQTIVENVNVSVSTDYSINSCVSLTGAESESYLQGYNAGYSAGETVGESNGYSYGYSDGFVDGEQSGYDSGFQAGQDSVDTQSYYDSGYSAGYSVGYSSGYEDGYEDGYSEALKAVQGSSFAKGNTITLSPPTQVECLGNPFYVSSYGLVDMEEYQSGANGYFYNTVPGTYQGTTVLSYNIPFYSLNGNSYLKFDGNSARFSFELMSLVPSLTADTGNGITVANFMHSKIREVYVTYQGKKYYGNYSTSTSFAKFDFLVTDFPSDSNYLLNGDMTLYFVVENSVTLVTDDISHYISARYTPSVSFMLGRSNTGVAMLIIPYFINDRVSANIQNQTDEIKENNDKNTDTIVNGFDGSSGSSMNSGFETGLNDYTAAEDSLFQTASTGMQDFSFFDISSVPAMVTGLSFVSSVMTSWFNQAGGASGVGIVLSILFSVMLVSMALGLYRFFQSKGGKD